MMWQPSTTTARDAGFTLLEMLVVLAILSLTGIVAITYGGRGGAAVSAREFTRSIARAAAQTALLAVSKGATESLVFLPMKNHMTGVSSGNEILIPEGVIFSVTAASELVQDNSLAVIDFYPDGTSSGGDIQVTDANGVSYYVRILWLTGAITTGAAP